jgi:hypothetical protein
VREVLAGGCVDEAGLDPHGQFVGVSELGGAHEPCDVLAVHLNGVAMQRPGDHVQVAGRSLSMS